VRLPIVDGASPDGGDPEQYEQRQRIQRAVLGRRLVLGAGGVTLLAACAPSPEKLAGRPLPIPRSRPTTGAPSGPSTSSTSSKPPSPPASGAPFPTEDPSSAAPGDSHTGADAPPSDTVTTAPGQQQTDPPPPPGKPQFYVHEGDKAIALTIDDGPDSRYTPQVLALLAQYKISATFCMLGQSVANHAGLVHEVVAAGHLVANHTFTHANLTKADVNTVRGEITRANDALAAAGAKPPTFFRVPFGAWSPAVFAVCQELGLRPLDWSVDPRDWSRPGTDHIVDTVLGHTHTGSIILEHDGGGDRSQTVAALGRFLPRLLEQGYRFVQP
jgi:peptidoglycan/xylan/chitin deacetylase (PgdA/CDA1 family)